PPKQSRAVPHGVHDPRTCDALTLKPEAALGRDSELDLAHAPDGWARETRGAPQSRPSSPRRSPGHPQFVIVPPSHRYSAAFCGPCDTWHLAGATGPSSVCFKPAFIPASFACNDCQAAKVTLKSPHSSEYVR